MASLPPQQSRRRSSPSRQQSSPERTFEAIQRADSVAPSTTSVDSQTVFLNNPTSPDTSTDQTPAQQVGGRTSQTAETEEPRKCWICFSDETEDTPESSVWRSPCPCALTAHEACLLDWIADIEAPNSSRSTAAQTKIACPQCKAEIKLSRPRNFIIDVVNSIEKYTSQALLPTVLAGLGTSILLGCSAHGAHTIRTVFGFEDAQHVLQPVGARHDWERRLIDDFPNFFRPFFQEWRGLRMELGLPLIPLALVASRTTLADTFLPFLPLAFFLVREDASQFLTRKEWPPGPEMTIILLPYVRGIYNEYLERVWGEKERRWWMEVQPRHRAEGNEDEEIIDMENRMDREDEDMELGIELEVNIIGDAEEMDNADMAAAPPPPNIARVPAPALDEPPAADAGQQQHDHHHDHPLRAAGQNNEIVISLTKIASTTLGALMFPDISALAGGLLYYALPNYFTSLRFYRGRPVTTGLLQTRWGRSIIGGCLFVVLKDAVRIYCRWRMAKAHRERRVVDYDGPGKVPSLRNRARGIEIFP